MKKILFLAVLLIVADNIDAQVKIINQTRDVDFVIDRNGNCEFVYRPSKDLYLLNLVRPEKNSVSKSVVTIPLGVGRKDTFETLRDLYILASSMSETEMAEVEICGFRCSVYGNRSRNLMIVDGQVTVELPNSTVRSYAKLVKEGGEWLARTRLKNEVL